MVSVAEEWLPVQWAAVQRLDLLAVVLDPVVAAPPTAMGPQVEKNVQENCLPPPDHGPQCSGLGGRPLVVPVLGDWLLVQ